VQLGTTNENTAMDLVGEGRVKSFDTFDTPVAALITGDVDAVIIDKVAAVGFMGENPGKLKMAGDVTSGEFLGFVFPPGSDLIAPVDAALEAMQADGTLEQLNKKWFEPEPAAGAMADLGGKEVAYRGRERLPALQLHRRGHQRAGRLGLRGLARNMRPAQLPAGLRRGRLGRAVRGHAGRPV